MYQVFVVIPEFDNRDAIVGSRTEEVSPKYTLRQTAEGYAAILEEKNQGSDVYFKVCEVNPLQPSQLLKWELSPLPVGP